MKKRILIMGYGNPLRHDDAVGIEVVCNLRQRITEPNYNFMTAIQPYPEMLEQIKDVDLLVVLDASLELEVGQTQCKQLFGDGWTLTNPNMTHFIGPEWLLLLSEQLYGRKPDALLFAIGGEDFGYGEGLSQTLNSKLIDIVDSIHREIQQAVEVMVHA